MVMLVLQFAVMTMSAYGQPRPSGIPVAVPTRAGPNRAPYDFELELFDLVNERRMKGYTCPRGTVHPPREALKWDCRLWAASVRHSEDMAANNFMEHKGSDGSNFMTRSVDAGIPADIAWGGGENIGLGPAANQPERMLAVWLQSDAHCNGLMNGRYKIGAIGFAWDGVVKQTIPMIIGNLWTQKFGAEQPNDMSCMTNGVDLMPSEFHQCHVGPNREPWCFSQLGCCCTSTNKCGVGQGACDPRGDHSDCADGLYCAENVGAKYGANRAMDVCEPLTGPLPTAKPTTPGELRCDPKKRDYNCCTSNTQCGHGEGDCDTDVDCQFGHFCAQNVGGQYGGPTTMDICESNSNTPAPTPATTPAPTPATPPAPTRSNCDPKSKDWQCCSQANQCGHGEGDCDSNGDCLKGHVCMQNVGAIYGAVSSMDVCELASATPAPTPAPTATPPAPTRSSCDPKSKDWQCCSPTNKCGHGEGDCDNSGDCLPGHVCAQNVGANYGAVSSMDVCELASATPAPTPAPTTGATPPAPTSCDPKAKDWHCCSSTNKCGHGQGDCDNSGDCLPGHVCAQNVGAIYGAVHSMDVCELASNTPAPTPAPTPGTPTRCDPKNNDWTCCTQLAPCGHGQGDCDDDLECMIGHTCAHDVGSSYGASRAMDICERDVAPSSDATPTVARRLLNLQRQQADN